MVKALSEEMRPSHRREKEGHREFRRRLQAAEREG
jgi:hypothetical protein